MKKNVLLLLLALITVPAWAGDAAQPTTQPAPEIQAAPCPNPAPDNPLSLTASPKVNALKAILEGTTKDADATATGCTLPCTLQQCPPGSPATCRQRACGALCP